MPWKLSEEARALLHAAPEDALVGFAAKFILSLPEWPAAFDQSKPDSVAIANKQADIKAERISKAAIERLFDTLVDAGYRDAAREMIEREARRESKPGPKSWRKSSLHSVIRDTMNFLTVGCELQPYRTQNTAESRRRAKAPAACHIVYRALNELDVHIEEGTIVKLWSDSERWIKQGKKAFDRQRREARKAIKNQHKLSDSKSFH